MTPGTNFSPASAVTGVAALVWSQFPNVTPSDVRQRLIDTVDHPVDGQGVPYFAGRCVSNGRINAATAMGSCGQ